MRIVMAKTITSVLAVLAVLAIPAAAAAAAPGPYRTDAQAERYLETQLAVWAGVNLHPPANPPDEFAYARDVPAPSASCVNGYDSDHEKRTKRHFRPVQRTNRAGEYTFRSFACSLSAYSDTDGDGQVTYSDDERTFHLYLQTRLHGRWVVMTDR
jgi:hypothetical protein